MTVEYLKKASKTSEGDEGDVRQVVQDILDDIEKDGDSAARRYAAKFDRYDGNLILNSNEIDEASAKVSQKLKDDIRFAHDNVRRVVERGEKPRWAVNGV